MSTIDMDVDIPENTSASVPQAQKSPGIMTASSYAISTSLSVYDDGIEVDGRLGRDLFAVQKLAKFGNTTDRLKAIAGAAPNTLPSVLPSSLELMFDQDDESIAIVLWVGMLPSGSDAKSKTSGVKGESVNNMRNVNLIATDPLAMRVVCPRGRETATYYALTKQDETSKLCSGVMVDMDFVCFFPEFRDDKVTSVAERRKKWPEKVRTALGQSQKAKRNGKRTYDETKSVVGPERAISSEVTACV